MNIFQITYLTWIVSEIILNRIARSGKTDKKSVDENSEIYIWISIMLSTFVGVFITIEYSVPMFNNGDFKITGLVLIILGIVFRLVAIKQLGRFFTVDVTIRKDHQLMQSGLYKYIRHPSYSGVTLSLLGFGISLDNWASLFIVFIPTFFSLVHRMNIEEKVLVEQFGEQYKNYILKTKRLIPFIY